MEIRQKILNKILNASEEQLDTAFAVLKYPQIGILRKIKCFSMIFGIDFDELLSILAKTSDDRILNKKSKDIMRNLLLERVKYGQKEKQK